MLPIKFKEHNRIYAKNQKPYLPLPVFEDTVDGGRIIHCWGLSFSERIKIFFTGRLWIHVKTFNNPPHPIKPMVDNPFKA